MTQRRWQWVCIAVIAGIYTWSLPLPALTAPLGGLWTGWDLVLIGMRAPYLWCWWPNILLFVGFLMLAIRSHRTAMILGILATLGAGLCALEFERQLYVGYFLWLTSMMLLACAGGFLSIIRDRGTARQQTPKSFQTALFDPSISAPFSPRQEKPPVSTELQAPSLCGDQPSVQIRPPCSRSS